MTRVTVGRKKQASRKHYRFSKHKVNFEAVKMPMNRHHSDLSELDYLHFIKTGVISDSSPD